MGLRLACEVRCSPDACTIRRRGARTLKGQPLWRAPSGQGFLHEWARADPTDELQGCAQFTEGIKGLGERLSRAGVLCEEERKAGKAAARVVCGRVK